MSVVLVPMTPADHLAWMAWTVPNYAEEKVKNGAWQAHDAVEKSAAAMNSLLPQGLATPAHYFFVITRPENGEAIGHVWFAANDIPGTAYIYDIFIKPDFRRQGFGRLTMIALESATAALGFNAIALHVFGHNHAAEALYRSVGYEVTDLNMRKSLPPKT